MGPQRFARETGVSAAVGKEFIERYHRTYRQIFNYLETTQKMAIAEGFVTTLQGRRRYFEFIGEELQQLRGTRAQDIDLKQLRLNYQDAQRLRGAANAPIQGSSADIIKLAMVKLAPQLQSYSAQMLLQVHDELILEMPPQEWPILKPLIQKTMEEAVSLSVPLQVEIRQGQNWLEAK
jgi:DNA polymerase-1